MFQNIFTLLKELHQHFPNLELMNVLGMVYPHYWVNVDNETTFPCHVEVIVSFYYVSKMARKLLVHVPLNKLKLDYTFLSLKQPHSTT